METSAISALVFMLKTTDRFLWIHKHLQLSGWMIIISGHFQVSPETFDWVQVSSWVIDGPSQLSLIHPCTVLTVCLGSVSFSPVRGPKGGVVETFIEYLLAPLSFPLNPWPQHLSQLLKTTHEAAMTVLHWRDGFKGSHYSFQCNT